MGQKLPFLTTAMVSISSFLQTQGLFLLGAVVGLIILANQLVKNQNIKRRVDKFILGLPIVGRVVRDVAAARFARTFATLANSGAPVLDCLSAARETTLNLVMRDAVDEMRDAVREGGSLNKAMSKTAAFPPLVVHMAASGEDGGRLGHMFDKGAEYLENEFEAASSVALGLLEPLITVIMGGLVLMIILAIMLPILQNEYSRIGIMMMQCKPTDTYEQRDGEHQAAEQLQDAGFSLVELMVVVFIMGLLATVVLVNVVGNVDKARLEKAKTDIAVLEQSLDRYRLEMMNYPTIEQGLEALVSAPGDLRNPERYPVEGFIKRLPEDPWGSPYQYVYPGENGAFDIYSYGADGQPGGEGYDADIGNWSQ